MQCAWRRASGLVIIALTALCASATVRADEYAGKWEVGGDLLSTTMDNDTTIQDALGFRLRGNYHFTKTHTIELTYDAVSADTSVKTSDISYDLTKIMVSYLGSFKNKKPDSKVSSFGVFGIGQVSYDNGEASDDSTVFQAGGGVRVRFTKSLAFRVDGRIWHFHGDSFIIPRDGFFSLDIAAGVSWFFGKGK
ncbi:MAG TPA: outer membrane beta-barrel protein [Candidatus Polarisedimenticolia bacterium]|nr:outer membrane beta-barrel protein [Candidatus Polarisedimenticolia bacterium]